jgi:SseB protein N-terminal domain
MPFDFFRRKPTFPKNDDLLSAITILATQHTPENYRDFYTVLLKSKLLLAEEIGQARPILGVDKEGNIVLPVFTDVERVKKVYPDASRVGTMAAAEIFRLAMNDDIHAVNINPEHGPGIFLSREEMGYLANDTIPHDSGTTRGPLGDGKFVPFGDPKLPSEETLKKMVQAARDLLAEESKVQEGFVILTRSDKGHSQLTIGLYGKEQNIKNTAMFSQTFVNTLEDVIGGPLRLMWLDEDDYEAIRVNSAPFYVRGD